MILNSIILFLAVMVPGVLVSRIIGINGKNYKYFLVFAGAYLFSITVVHILPELFQTERHSLVGLMVLAGFFFQQVLEYFSRGIEHGHMHAEEHMQSSWGAASLLIAMTMHALLEGTILAHPSTLGEHHDISGLLAGIVLHKVPASVALAAVLLSIRENLKGIFLPMLFFALASPVGLWIGTWWLESNTQSDLVFELLFAFVSGNFLHISTTIVFETSPDHKFNLTRFAISLLGAIVAILTEFVI